eukprot:1318338-Prymnesium_polylepis.1
MSARARARAHGARTVAPLEDGVDLVEEEMVTCLGPPRPERKHVALEHQCGRRLAPEEDGELQRREVRGELGEGVVACLEREGGAQLVGGAAGPRHAFDVGQ